MLLLFWLNYAAVVGSMVMELVDVVLAVVTVVVVGAARLALLFASLR